MRFQCSNCDQIVSIDDSVMGSVVTCGHCNNLEEVPQEKFAPRTVINDYVIIEKIGVGRLASVYLAHQMTLDRKVALKILSKELADDSDFIIDFFREARSAGRLNHPNIVQAYAVSEEDGVYYLVMEYIEGSNLKQIIDDQGALPCDYALRIIHQMAEALSFIWKNHKICHENIKPENILLTKGNTAKLSDTGLSKAARNLDTSIAHICPEKILGSKTDIRSDLYSLGITFYEMLTGDTPFEGTNEEIRKQHLKSTPRPVSDFRSDVPPSYLRITDKLLAKHPDDRYQSPEGLINDIKLARGAKDEKSIRKATIKNNRSTFKKSSKDNSAKNNYLILSVVINLISVVTIVLMLSGQTQVKVAPKVEENNNDQILLYHQIALDVNSGEIKHERAISILEDVNSFIKRFPDSPHLPIALHWKNNLEETIIRSMRYEEFQKEKLEFKETQHLENIAE